MKDQQQFTQVLATIILFFGCACVGAADKWNWRDLAGAGTTVLGVGAGILTGQKLATMTHTDSFVNLNPPAGGPDPKV